MQKCATYWHLKRNSTWIDGSKFRKVNRKKCYSHPTKKIYLEDLFLAFTWNPLNLSISYVLSDEQDIWDYICIPFNISRRCGNTLILTTFLPPWVSPSLLCICRMSIQNLCSRNIGAIKFMYPLPSHKSRSEKVIEVPPFYLTYALHII